LVIPDNPKALGKLLAQMEKQMLDHAQNLEFEEAAQLRDQVIQIKRENLIG
jgi:excinuclease ABC subunit B